MRDLDAANDVVLFAEVRDETGYVKHHKQKIALIFAAMRGFASRLESRGVTVRYVRIDDAENTQSLTGELARARDALSPTRIVVTEPGEWRLRVAFDTFAESSPVPTDIREDDRFICSHTTFALWAEDRRELRMELFYREMRKRTGLLMDGGNPEGGQWNYDHDNRKRLPKAGQRRRRIGINRAERQSRARRSTTSRGCIRIISARSMRSPMPTTPDEAEHRRRAIPGRDPAVVRRLSGCDGARRSRSSGTR